MDLAKDLILDDYYKLKISSKRLSSGRYQVKFHASVQGRKDLYGYVLVNSNETLKMVTHKIKKKLQSIESASDYHPFHLYNMQENHDGLNFMIFK